MPNPWFRMYAEFATDAKVQMLNEVDQRRFVMLLCIRCGNDDETFQDDEVAFQLRISNDEWQRTKAILMERNLITEGNNPVKWEKRQYLSDSSTERVRKHREQKKRKRNVSVTPPDTDTDTEVGGKPPTTPRRETRSEPAAAKKAPAIKPKFQPPDWVPQDAWREFVKMRDRIRKPMTERAKELLVDELDKLRAAGNDPRTVLEQSIANSWQGVFPPKNPYNGARKSERLHTETDHSRYLEKL